MWESGALALSREENVLQRRAEAGLIIRGCGNKLKGDHPPFVFQEDAEGGKAGLRDQDWSWCGAKAVGNPSLNLAPLEVNF